MESDCMMAELNNIRPWAQLCCKKCSKGATRKVLLSEIPKSAPNFRPKNIVWSCILYALCQGLAVGDQDQLEALFMMFRTSLVRLFKWLPLIVSRFKPCSGYI